MKRIWLGIGILALFLALGLWSAHSMGKLHIPLAQDLEKAASSALSGDMQLGQALAKKAKETWDAQWHKSAIWADHTPMDEIDGLFARLEAFSETKNAESFAAYCKQLAKLITATAEAHSLNWWNIL